MVVSLKLAHGTQAAQPNDPVTVEVAQGTLKSLEVLDAKGAAVPGKTTGNTFTPTRYFALNSTYTVRATVVDQLEVESTQQVRFTTLKPTAEAGFDLLYTGFEGVGVGMPATIQFVSEVTTHAQRQEVEKHVHVTTVPAQEGHWGWLDNRQLMWRPRTYLKPGTTVRIKADLAGIQTGPGKWLTRDSEGGFTVGAARISTVDIANHTMTVTRDGAVVKTIPITTGKAGFTTRSGTKVIIERYKSIIMDSTTVDIPKGSADAYHLDVKWAMRVTWTGEFLHAAPWSVGSQGRANVSHGCVGMSTANAEWMFNFSRAGDVVFFKGSNRPFLPTEGIGVWQYSYDQWCAQSALD